MIASFASQPEVWVTSYVEVLTILSVISFLGALVVAYRKINCHEPKCWRIGKHHVEGTPYVTCHRHHPGLPGNSVQPGHIRRAHAKANK